MKHFCQACSLILLPGLALSGCSRHSYKASDMAPKTYASQIVMVSGGNQAGAVGSDLPEPIVVQVNGADGAAAVGALVSFHGDGMRFTPESALSDLSGMVSTTVQAPLESGSYEIVAETRKPGSGTAAVKLREVALGYEQTLGHALDEIYCIRCHDRESTPERVSNFDNLSPAPHEFSDASTFDHIADADLIEIITHGGPSLHRSPEMPPYGATLRPDEIKGIVAYIRAVSSGTADTKAADR
jgi:mono/diheme cytochrome c family protein